MSEFYAPMFSVPLFRYRLEGWSSKKARILQALPPDDEKLSPAPNTYTDYFANRKGTSVPPYAHVIKDVLKPELEDFRSAYPEDLVLTSMWFERSYKSGYHGTHNHGSLGFSAVLYVEFDPAAHRPTRFIAPFQDFYSGSLVEYIPPKMDEGTLVLFPSVILHEAQPHESGKARTIVSFNIRGGAQ